MRNGCRQFSDRGRRESVRYILRPPQRSPSFFRYPPAKMEDPAQPTPRTPHHRHTTATTYHNHAQRTTTSRQPRPNCPTNAPQIAETLGITSFLFNYALNIAFVGYCFVYAFTLLGVIYCTFSLLSCVFLFANNL